jgi:hypothetical protein
MLNFITRYFRNIAFPDYIEKSFSEAGSLNKSGICGAGNFFGGRGFLREFIMHAACQSGHIRNVQIT